ncbi:MAG: serine/threonine-protein kinase [Acidobacteriia bacterium]|nr:serine/threonine-protein kinase [Terriglobia bacterium]
MAFSAGEKLGPYQLLSLLGEGGMGMVWKARDTRLDRIVAVKVSKEEFSERFEREARAIAALNHPNICQLYDIGPNYLVMEFIEGETVAAKVKARPLKLGEALRIAYEASAGLQAAHEKGIVHRDIKSANLMVTSSGQVKVTDFGLALARERSRLTQTGMAVGTPAYMAPEQTRGDAVDARADIWALGVMLHEMVTGQSPFARDSEAATMNAILHEDPEPVTALRSGVPVELDRIVGKALQKDPASRYQHVEDFAVDVGTLRRLSSGAHAAGGRPRRGWRWAAAVGLVAALALALAMFGSWLYTRSGGEPGKLMHAVIPSPEGDLWGLTPMSSLALSPDGETLAYSAQRGGGSQIFLRKLDGREPVLLAGTEGGMQPFYSPDGEWIGFSAGGKLRKLSMRDGRVVALADAPGMRGGTWTADDWIYFTPDSKYSTGLWRVPANGGTPQVVTKPDLARDAVSHRWPQVLPGGKSLLFTVWSTVGVPNARLAVLDLKTGAHQEVVQGGSGGQYTEPGYLLYARGARAEELEAVPFDLSSLKVTGRAIALAGGLDGDPFNGYAPFVALRDRLIYRRGGLRTQHMVLLDRRGRVENENIEEAPVHTLGVSLRGGVAAFARFENQKHDIWLMDFGRRSLGRFTSGAGSKIIPVFSTDGRSVAFSSNRDGPLNLYRAPIGQPDKTERLTRSLNVQFASSWAPTGDKLVFDEYAPSTGGDIWLVDLTGDHKADPLVRTPFDEVNGKISPDGKWLAFQSNETGRSEVYVQPYPGSGSKVQVSTRGGRLPNWTSAGNLTYLEAGRMMESKWTGQGAQGEPAVLFDRGSLPAKASVSSYDVSADGRFLVLEQRLAGASDPSATLQLIVNWTAALK